MKEYTGATYTKASEMYSTYELAKLLNEDLTEKGYKEIIDKITETTNYAQHVVLYDGKPVSMCATQDNLNMSVAPALSCLINNIATLPDHRGAVTRLILDCVKDKFKQLGYDNVNLRSLKGNVAADKFYEKSGFEQKSNAWLLKLQDEIPRARL